MGAAIKGCAWGGQARTDVKKAIEVTFNECLE